MNFRCLTPKILLQILELYVKWASAESKTSHKKVHWTMGRRSASAKNT
jgi:hypothetical protein